MEGNQKTRIQKFMGGNKKGYQTAFHMAWPAAVSYTHLDEKREEKKR